MTSVRTPEPVVFSIENSANVSITQIETRLYEIRTQVLDNNIYQLSWISRSNLRIVLNTFDYIINDIIKLQKHQYDGLIDPNTRSAPIHLENHPGGTTRNASLKRTLLVPFIITFNNVENAGPKFVQRFCGELDGYCIDARTRSAFDYGFNLSYTLANRIQDGQDNLSYKYKDRYFAVMAEMLSSDYWGLHYDADTTKNSISKVSGYINEDIYFDEESGIAGFIKNILAFDRDNTFLKFCEKVPLERWTLFLKVILNEEDFLAELNFNAKEQHEFDALVCQTTAEKPGLLSYALSQSNYTNQIESLLRALTPAALTKICQSEQFIEIIKQLGFRKTLTIFLDRFNTAELHHSLLELLAHIELLKKISATDLSIITELLQSHPKAQPASLSTWLSLSITRERAYPTPDLNYIASTLMKFSASVMLSALDMQPHFLRNPAVINSLLKPVLQSLITKDSLPLLKTHDFLRNVIQVGSDQDVIKTFEIIINHASKKEANEILSTPYVCKLLITHHHEKTFTILNQMLLAKGLTVAVQALLLQASQWYLYENFQAFIKPFMTPSYSFILSHLVRDIHTLADNRYPENLALLQTPAELAAHYTQETNQPQGFFDVLRALQSIKTIPMTYIQDFVKAALPGIFQNVEYNKGNISNRLMVEFLLVTNAILAINTHSSSSPVGIASYTCDGYLLQQLERYPNLLAQSIDFIVKIPEPIQANLLKHMLRNTETIQILRETALPALAQLVQNAFVNVHLGDTPNGHCLENLKAYIADTKNPKRIIAAAQAMYLLSETPTNMLQLKALLESVKEKHGKFKLTSSKLASHLEAYLTAAQSIAPVSIAAQQPRL